MKVPALITSICQILHHRFGASGDGSSLICGVSLALVLFNPLVSPSKGVAS
jgi:hypothetical protein